MKSKLRSIIDLAADVLRMPGRLRSLSETVAALERGRRQLEDQVLVQTARTHHRIDGITMLLNENLCRNTPHTGFTLHTRSEIDRMLSDLESRSQVASYSRYGEDLLIKSLFDSIGISKPSYLDLGAHSPTHLSNTALLHDAESRGVNVEADPRLISRFHELRPEDVNLNVGVGVRQGSERFYRFKDSPALGTFDEAEVTRLKNVGKEVEEVMELKVMPVNDIIRDHFADGPPDFLTIDIEGADQEVLQSIDFSTFRPAVICVEINAHDTLLRFIEREFLLFSNQYFHYGDAGGELEGRNAIYVDFRYFPLLMPDRRLPTTDDCVAGL